jgi:hypothetical protein
MSVSCFSRLLRARAWIIKILSACRIRIGPPISWTLRLAVLTLLLRRFWKYSFFGCKEKVHSSMFTF